MPFALLALGDPNSSRESLAARDTLSDLQPGMKANGIMETVLFIRAPPCDMPAEYARMHEWVSSIWYSFRNLRKFAERSGKASICYHWNVCFQSMSRG